MLKHTHTEKTSEVLKHNVRKPLKSSTRAHLHTNLVVLTHTHTHTHSEKTTEEFNTRALARQSSGVKTHAHSEKTTEEFNTRALAHQSSGENH